MSRRCGGGRRSKGTSVLSRVPIDPGYAVVIPEERVVVSPDEGVSPNPSRVGPSTSSTNPAGNELQGENSGGK